MSEGVTAQVLAYVAKMDRRLKVLRGGRRRSMWRGEHATLLSRAIAKFEARVELHLAQAGMADVSPAACVQAAARLAAMAAAVGAALGVAITPAMALFLGTAAAIAGASAPLRAIGQERRTRAEALAHELPEMLEVCALGLRSGLTFDRSFRLYPLYVGTPFARECELAMRRVDIGFASRTDALAGLSAGYDSPLLARTLDGVEQALCRGTSLIGDLERAADESRKQFRAAKEQMVAKAPIKMMIPIGVLILPAMLLLVLGPVVLGLVQGI